MTVAIVDDYGNATSYSGTVSLALANNPGGSFLGGVTMAPVDSTGYATFTRLSLSNVSNGYTLTASVTGLSSTVTTTGINVVPVAAPPPADH